MAAEQRTFLFLVLEGTETIDSGDENCHHKIIKSCMVAEGIIFFTKKLDPKPEPPNSRTLDQKYILLFHFVFQISKSGGRFQQRARAVVGWRMNWNELISE